MKIGIDVSPIIYGTGVSVYTRNLVRNLLKIDDQNDYLLFGGSFRRYSELKSNISLLSDKSAHSKKTLPIPPFLGNLIWNNLHIIPVEKLFGKMDVYHSSDWTQAPSTAFKVTTVHDLSPILFPHLTHPKIVSAHKSRLNWVLKECDRVIVPSNATANDLSKLGFNHKYIRVIGEAIDPSVSQSEGQEIERVKRKYRIDGDYLLSVGVNHRKNTKRIIEAFEKIKPDYNVRLVIIGHSQEKLPITKGIMFTGHVPQSDLSALFSGATVLVYPSLYEGYGLPILEAFACRVPVVTSNIGSMKEIGEDAVVLVDPNDTESIVEGVKLAIKNRKTFINRGIKLVKKYSWENVARQTLSVYKESV